MPLFGFTRFFTGIRRIVNPGDGGRFWIAQIMVIISTIIGVYLAANAGFEKAIEFDHLAKKRDMYYMLTALQAELKDNIEIMNLRVKDVNNTTDHLKVAKLSESRPVEDFVWDSLKESGESFRIPPEIITHIRRYYSATHHYTEDMEGFGFARSHYKKLIEEENKKLREIVFPLIDETKMKLKQELEESGLEI